MQAFCAELIGLVTSHCTGQLELSVPHTSLIAGVHIEHLCLIVQPGMLLTICQDPNWQNMLAEELKRAEEELNNWSIFGPSKPPGKICAQRLPGFLCPGFLNSCCLM